MIDIDAFFDTPEDSPYCVHAATEEEAKIVMRWFIDRGKRLWIGGASRAKVTHWDKYKKDTVYFPRGTFGDATYAKSCGYTVYEVSDFTTEKMEWNEVFV